MLFISSTHYAVLATSRFFAGFFQVFVQIVSPVWVDVYGPEGSKTKWLTILIGAGPLGLVGGYALAATANYMGNWHWAFFGKSLILAVISLALMYIGADEIDISRRQKSAEVK